MPSLAAGIANNCFEWTPFFIISRSEMIKNGVHSKFSFAATGGGMLSTQPQDSGDSPRRMFFGGASRKSTYETLQNLKSSLEKLTLSSHTFPFHKL